MSSTNDLKNVKDTKKPKKKRRTSSKKLYKMIKEDPNHEVYGVPSSISYWQMISLIVSIGSLGFLVTWFVSDYYHSVGNTDMVMLVVLGFCVLFIFLLMLGYILDGYLFDKVLISELGLGKELRGRTLKGAPTGVYGYIAIKWNNVERIDVSGKEAIFNVIRFRSENRELQFSKRYFCRGMSIDDLKRYIPVFESWILKSTSSPYYDDSYFRPD